MEEQEVKRSFHVAIDIIQTHEFVIDDVNSAEEAIDIAEEWLDDGETGNIINKEVFGRDAYPVEKEELS